MDGTSIKNYFKSCLKMQTTQFTKDKKRFLHFLGHEKEVLNGTGTTKLQLPYEIILRNEILKQI